MKEDKIGCICRTHRGEKKYTKRFERYACRKKEYNIKMVLRGTECNLVDWVYWPRKEMTGGIL
jgi:hypothetical protein